ncbi:hypothetical protein BD289DRAFT_451807 [Coniella lustricola]|uniref:WD40-repeat-containing domain protein n=1 Tax=Coniella lustricola TaxID=2025994 RepID=A0A2T3ADD5_9PEZI|nr:hypothetical protein BD289DRAFT_451807 [Coniella lustricola]
MEASEGEAIASLQSLILDLPPSCIEVCPAHPTYFVVGTYYLERGADNQTEEVRPSGDDDEEKADADSSEAKAASPQSRNGSVIVFRLEDGKVHLLQTIAQPSAVFDLHFQPQQDTSDVFATVSSTGSISFFRLSPPSHVVDSTEEGRKNVATTISTLRIPDMDEDVLFTYFTWHPTIRGLMSITTASGNILLVQVNDEYQGVRVLNSCVLQHSLEAWVVAFSPPSAAAASSSSSPMREQEPYTLFSGGDDSALKYLTLNLPSPHPQEENTDDDDDDDDAEQELTPPFPAVTLKDHTAGVTAILPLSLLIPSTSTGPSPNSTPVALPHLLLTGSYDDTIRLFLIHPLHITYGMRKASLLAEKNLGGGVWRLSVVGTPSVTTTTKVTTAQADAAAETIILNWQVIILASCMHAGTRILRIRGSFEYSEGEATNETTSTAEIEVLARFEEHKSMNYGSDWSRVESNLYLSGTARRDNEKADDHSNRENEVVCVSTSFYDRLLCVWKFKIPE